MAEFDRLLIFRALRPDRLTVAMRSFVAGVLGKEYITSRPFDLELACQVRIDVPILFASTQHGLIDMRKRMQRLGFYNFSKLLDSEKYGSHPI